MAIISVSQSHKSDAEMKANFKAHQKGFETLLRMIKEDMGLERVDDTWTRPADPATIKVSRERIAAYRTLFKEVGIPRGIEAYDLERRSVSFLASTQGTTVAGSVKGYVWCEIPPDGLVSSLDPLVTGRGVISTTGCIPPKSQGWCESSGVTHGYCPIEGNWYLYFSRD